jgi:hypothetical protein
MAMAKRPFTTRIDPEVLALAQRIAAAERRSITAVIEMAVLEYARKRGLTFPEKASVQSPRDTSQ